jgi:hypothetical protein
MEGKTLNTITMENKWISVKDELPKAHTEVLLFRDDASIMIGQYTYLEGFLSDEDISDYDEPTLFDFDFFCYLEQGLCRLDGCLIPTHWQHLPQPPKN